MKVTISILEIDQSASNIPEQLIGKKWMATYRCTWLERDIYEAGESPEEVAQKMQRTIGSILRKGPYCAVNEMSIDVPHRYPIGHSP